MRPRRKERIMDFQASGATDIGRVREGNEDAFVIDTDLGLYVVSDGMGGHAAGEVASRIAVDSVVDLVRAERQLVLAVAADEKDHSELVSLAERAVQKACQDVYRHAIRDPALSGMGCTLTVLLLADRRGAMAHVGDTRLYLFRDGAAELLSTDHTMAEEMRRSGQMTSRQAADSRYSSMLTRCLGAQESVPVETLMIEALLDDAFLICSDGLSSCFAGLSEIASFMSEDDIHGLPARLISMANHRGGGDNITAVVLRAQAGRSEQELLAEDAIVCQEQVRVLKGVDVFQGVKFADILRLRNIAEVRLLGAGEMAVRAGERCSGLHIVIEGQFALQGGEAERVVLEPGQHFGLTTLMEPRATASDLVALGDGALLRHRIAYSGWRAAARGLASYSSKGLHGRLAGVSETKRGDMMTTGLLIWFSGTS